MKNKKLEQYSKEKLDEIFEKAIDDKNFELINQMLNSKKFIVDENHPYIANPALDGHIDVIELLLKDFRFTKIAFLNLAVLNASFNGHLDILKLLLNIKGVDPTINNNVAIARAYVRKQHHIVRFLFNINEVKKTLRNDHPVLFNELIQIDVEKKLNVF